MSDDIERRDINDQYDYVIDDQYDYVIDDDDEGEDDYVPGDEPKEFPIESVIDELPDQVVRMDTAKVRFPEQNKTLEVFDQVPTITMDVEVTCMHCGKRVGEFRKGNVAILSHPAVDGSAMSHTLILDPKDAPVDDNLNEYLGKMLGKWLRSIHKYPEPEDVKARLLSIQEPPPPSYTESHPNEHIAGVFNDLVGESIRQIAAALHIVEVLGPMEQWTVDLSDDCGFKGSILMRVQEVGNCATYGQVVGTDTATTSEDPETQLLRAIFNDNSSQRRDGDDSDNTEPNEEPYRHDPSDPSHDD